MNDPDDIIATAAQAMARFRATVDQRPVAPHVDFDTIRDGFGTTLPIDPSPPETVLDDLIRAAEPGITATVGPRYFGFVIGGALPSATAADMLALGWDQPAFNATTSLAGIAVEQVAGRWAKELLGIPEGASVGFVTGAQEANTVGLAAARLHVLAEHGWDVGQDGLQGAPPIRVVVGDERHSTIDRSLRLLGLGTGSAELVRTDGNGAIDVGHLEEVLGSADGPTIVCLQSGNVNTGACDDLERSCAVAHTQGAWVHVDGAFGLWAAASPEFSHLTHGIEQADSWGCDAHKWLNVPYDSGLAFVSRPDVHGAAMSMTAAYLIGFGEGAAGGSDFVLGASRRARGFAVWAAIRELGRSGIAELVERNCALARRFADQLREAGAEIANDVVLNQVLVGFGDDETTDAVIDRVQRDGTCWMGGTTWRGRRYMRISVSNHTTTEADVDRSVEAIVRCWRP